MHQLEIQYFFPLTEQVPLDLDFKPCQQFEEEKRKQWAASSVVLTSGMGLVANGGTGLAWATVNNFEPSFCIDIDQTPLTVVSKNKPNIFRKYLYKIMGVKWKIK